MFKIQTLAIVFIPPFIIIVKLDLVNQNNVQDIKLINPLVKPKLQNSCRLLNKLITRFMTTSSTINIGTMTL